MRRTFVVCLMFALGATNLLRAFNACVPCDARFEAGAEAISWRPRIADQHYLIEDDRTQDTIGKIISRQLPSGRLETVDCNFNWGWRLFAAYVNQRTCYDVRGQYTWLHGTDHVSPGFVRQRVFWPSYGSPKFLSVPLIDGEDNTAQARFKASAGVKNDYDAFDVEGGWRGLSTCYYWLRLFGGLHFLHLQHTFTAHYQGYTPAFFKPAPDQNLDITVVDRQKLWSVGPRLGAEGQIEVYHGFGISGRFAAGILAGNTRGRHTEFGVIQPLQQADPRTVDLCARYCPSGMVTPFVNLRLGVTHSWCCGKNFVVVGEVGYEFFSYINAIRRMTFDDEAATSSTECLSFDIDGFYFSLRLVL